MRSITLVGVNALGEPVKLSKDMSHFVGHDDYFRVDPSAAVIKLTTPQAVYYLKKHPSQNIFTGVCKGKKVHVSLKKVVGELRFWS